LGHIIHDSDLVLQAILLTLDRDARRYIFNPVRLRNEIDDCHDKLINEVKHATRRALQSLRGLMDERSDYLVKKINPITASHLSTWREFKNYIETHLNDFREELRVANDRLEQQSTKTVVVSIDRLHDVNWRSLIELQEIRQTARDKQQSIGIIETPHFEHLVKGHNPFKSIEDQGVGNAIGASDHLVIFARGGNELCIVEAHADYRTIIPLSRDIDPAVTSVDIADLCWSSATGIFIVLTRTQLFTLSPNRKIPIVIPNVRPTDNRLFCSCACNGDKFLLCYTDPGSSLEEWCTTNWRQGRCWNSPQSCNEREKIMCIRFTQSGTFMGITLDVTSMMTRFEVRDPQTMSCVWSREILAPSCIGIISFTDTVWLIGVFNYHKIYLVDKSDNRVQEIKMTSPSKSSLRGMTLVDQGTVVVRTAKTVIFFDLFY
jgi:hypothetical protein